MGQKRVGIIAKKNRGDGGEESKICGQKRQKTGEIGDSERKNSKNVGPSLSTLANVEAVGGKSPMNEGARKRKPRTELKARELELSAKLQNNSAGGERYSRTKSRWGWEETGEVEKGGNMVCKVFRKSLTRKEGNREKKRETNEGVRKVMETSKKKGFKQGGKRGNNASRRAKEKASRKSFSLGGWGGKNVRGEKTKRLPELKEDVQRLLNALGMG